MKRLLLLCLLALGTLSLPVVYKRLTQGFKWGKLTLHVPYRAEWEVAAPDDGVRSVLQQGYTYLGKGAQCYVFESQDHKYVVKFFRYDQPPVFARKKGKSSSEKVERLFSACCLAFQMAQKETGLIYLHLNQTPLNLPPLIAKGPLGQTLRFSLDHFCFAIQKKALPFRQTLREALQAKDREKMKRLLDSFKELLSSRNQKGILNGDPTLSRNFGFVGETAIELDFGSYYLNPYSDQNDAHRYMNKLKHWLKKQGPEWVDYLERSPS